MSLPRKKPRTGIAWFIDMNFTRRRARRTKTMAFKVTKKGPARAAQRTGRYVFVGSTAKTFPAGVLVCRRFADLPTSVRETPKNRVFVSYRRSSTDNLLQEGLKLGRGARMGKLLTLEPPRPESVPSLSGILCNPSTVWRICRRYEDAGLPDLLEPPQRAGRPARISPPATRPDRSTGLPGAGRQGLAHHPLDEPGSGPPSGRRWDRPGHQRSDGPSDPQSSGPPAASHAVLADVSHRHSLQGACREDPLVLRQRRAVGPAGLLGGLCR